MICNRCGEALRKKDMFCPKCGAPIGRLQARHASSAQPSGRGKAVLWITVGAVVLTTLAIIAVLFIVFFKPGKEAQVPEETLIVETEAPTEEPTEDPFSISQSEIEVEIENIRTYYYTPGADDRKVVLENGTDGWNFSRDYRYHENQLVFAFVYDGTEEHRLYFKDDHMIRYIDEDHVTYDYPDTERYSYWETRVLEEAYELIGVSKKVMFESEWLGNWEASNGESLEIYKVDEYGMILTFNKFSEQGNMMNVDYEMEFDNENKTVASEIGGPEDHGGWEYTFELNDRYINVKSRYPDQVFYKK